jgi:predicted DNA-binding transcriptional regulator YafY
LADENNQLKNFTFSKIERFNWEDESKKFTPKKEFLEQIEKNDTNWFSNESIEVILKIDNSAKEYFLRKEILPNKKLLEQNDEYFTISTIVSYDDEILRVVKSWLPYIKIVSPQYLQMKLNDTLIAYINQ